MRKDKLRIESIKVLYQDDNDPDLSWIGKYTDSADEWNIERSTGEYVHDLPEDYEFPQRGREYRFFAPYDCGEVLGSKQYQKNGKHYYERMEGYGNHWYMIGISARAVVSRDIGGGDRKLTTFTSGGLWGIESDSDKEYLGQVENEQLDELREEILAYGIKCPKDLRKHKSFEEAR